MKRKNKVSFSNEKLDDNVLEYDKSTMLPTLSNRQNSDQSIQDLFEDQQQKKSDPQQRYLDNQKNKQLQIKIRQSIAFNTVSKNSLSQSQASPQRRQNILKCGSNDGFILPGIEASDPSQMLNYYKTLGQTSDNIQLKVNSIVSIGDIIKIHGNHQLSMKIYKNALHYCWLIKYKEKEIEIYDKLGKVHFEQGNIPEANYFHDRSLNGLVEMESSQILNHGVNFIRPIYENDKCTIFNGINSWLLQRIGLTQQGYEGYKVESKLNLKSWERILSEDQELRDEFPDPKYPINIGTQNGYISYSNDKVMPLTENRSDSLIIKKNFQNIIKQQNRQFPLHQSMMKMPLYKQIDQRLKQIENINKNEDHISALINYSQKRKPNNELFISLLNHQSPNRNAGLFHYYLKPNPTKVINYYQKMSKLVLGIDLGVKQK